MKRGFVLFIFILLVLPFLSASLESSMNEIDSYISQYEQGEISAPQLIVYVEYVKNKMYESLDEDGEIAFSEEEIKLLFKKNNNQDRGFTQYEKKFVTDDFDLIFRANSFFRHDKSYYEERQEDTKNYYLVDYELVAIDSESSDLAYNTKNFISDLNNLVEVEKNPEKEDLLKKDFDKIKQKFWNIKDREYCSELMKDIGMTKQEETFGKDQSFFYLIKEEKDKNCWTNQECEWVCNQKEVCEECVPNCYEKDVCENVCVDEEVCEGEEENQTCTTEQNCKDVCTMEEECETCEKNCWKEDDCHNDCKDVEQCDEFISGEIKIEGNCREDGSDIWVNAWGDEYDRYQRLNDGGGWSCENEIENFVKLRKVLQKDINDDFAKWYFEDFLNGNNYDKIINGGDGFENVLRILIRNEEDIANNLHCSETNEWPNGFEKIDITYINDNTHVEVWEKNIPIEWANTNYYTTLYKYSWIPDYELLKGLIDYQLEKTQTIGPTAGDVASIQADEGQMQLVNTLANNYGGSFDVKLELNEKDGDFVVKKYLQINPDVVIRFVDSIEEKEDISIEVDYDSMYNFINFIDKETQGEEIRGPNWVYVENQGGPGKFFSVVGAASKLWKEGITIKPRYALLKLVFNTKNIIGIISQGGSEPEYQGETTKLSGEVIRE